MLLTHTGLRRRNDAVDFGSGWHAHLAALGRRVRGEGVADFWALRDEAEAIVKKALNEQQSNLQ